MALADWVRWVSWWLCVGAGVSLGLGAYTFHYAKGTSYLSNDPNACANCHIMQEYYDSWVKSSHQMVATCNACHVPHTFPAKYWAKLRNGWNHSKAFTLQDFSEPIRIAARNLMTLQENCLHCHRVLVSEILGHEAIDENDTRCTACHRSVGHMSLA